MTNFYEGLAADHAIEIERLSRLVYELRRDRDTVLQPWGVADAGALLERIAAGQVAEHPAYEHYLSARILEDNREAVRELLAQRLKEVPRP